MNRDLAMIVVPETHEAAAEIWAAYSPRWQVFNTVRTVFSGLALALTGLAFLSLRQES